MMGAWGLGNFDNDTACDWVYDLEEVMDLSVIEKSINEVFEEECIDSDIACEALAAVDTLARLNGHFGVKNSYTETVDKWVQKNKLDVPGELIEKAKKAIKHIISESSELFELWSESEELDNWLTEIESLEKRLSS